jgi:hypothetical protein
MVTPRKRGRPRRDSFDEQIESTIASYAFFLHRVQKMKLKSAAKEASERALAPSRGGISDWDTQEFPEHERLADLGPGERAALRACYRRVLPSRAEKAYLRFRKAPFFDLK